MQLLRNSKILCLSHNDLDGEGPNIILRIIRDILGVERFDFDFKRCSNAEMDLAIRTAVEKETMSYNYDEILVVDISPTSEETLKAISTFINVKGPRLHVFDHHKTSEVYKAESWMNHNSSLCGTAGFWANIEEEIAEAIPTSIFLKLNKFVELVNDWDLWIWANTDKYAKEAYPMPAILSNALDSLGHEIFSNEAVKEIKYCESLDFKFKDFTCLYIDSMAEAYEFVSDLISSKTRINFLVVDKKGADTIFYYYTDRTDISKIAKLMFEAVTECTVQVILGPKSISFRKRESSNENILERAKMYGGGGHECACGCSVNNDSWELYMKYFDRVISNIDGNSR